MKRGRIATRRTNAKRLPPKRRPAGHRRGPAPAITLAVVKRVSKRVGLGLTLELALAAERQPQVNTDSWHKHLQRHPELSTHYDAARGQFLEASMRKLAAAKSLKFLCWLLERRHADLFRKSDPDVHVETNVNVGIPADVLERAREISRADGEGGAIANSQSPSAKSQEPTAKRQEPRADSQSPTHKAHGR